VIGFGPEILWNRQLRGDIVSGRLLARAALLLAAVAGFTAVAQDQGRTDNSATIATTPARGASGPKAIVPRNPRVLFITAKECDKCERELKRLRKPGGEFESMQARGWKIGESADNHIQIVDRADVPELAELLKGRELPTVLCVEHGEVVRYFKHGCTTPLDAWTFGWLMKGQNERPKAAVPEPIEVETTGHYPLRGNHWSVEGDFNPTSELLVRHLRGPNHGHQIATDWKIEEWSTEELRSLHDDLHEREGGGLSGGAFTQSPAAPTGVSQFGAGRKF
jgi:hypothetical protein